MRTFGKTFLGATSGVGSWHSIGYQKNKRGREKGRKDMPGGGNSTSKGPEKRDQDTLGDLKEAEDEQRVEGKGEWGRRGGRELILQKPGPLAVDFSGTRWVAVEGFHSGSDCCFRTTAQL